MRLRNLTWGLLVAAAVAIPARADDVRPAEPTVVVRLKSFDGLLADFRYVADLVGQGDTAKQIDALIPVLAGPQGLAGIGLDPKRPFVAYGTVAPNGIDSSAVVMIPTTNEKALVDLVNRLVSRFAPSAAEKGDDNVYTLKLQPSVPYDVYFRFANKYAYVTARDKTPLAKPIDPAKLIPTKDKDTAVAAVTIRLDRVPQQVKDIALTQIEMRAADARARQPKNETPAEAKLRTQAADVLMQQVKMLFTDGATIEAQFAIDRKSDDLSLQLSLAARPDSPLAGALNALSATDSLFGDFKGGNAGQVIVHAALPAALRPLLGPAVDDVVKDALDKEKDPNKKALAEKLLNAVSPTLKAGEVDLLVGLRGPDSAGHYGAVVGLKVQDGKAMEQTLKDVIGQVPTPPEGVTIRLDAEKIGGVSLHKISGPVDADAKKIFGDKAAVTVAFRNDAVLFAFGSDVGILKAALESRPQSAPIIRAEASVMRLTPLSKDAPPEAAKLAEKVFGSDPKGADALWLTLEGGSTLKLRLSTKGKAIQFVNQMSEAGKSKKVD
jgi:hypothetical protein